MMCVPLKINEREFDLMVVLEPDNLERMEQHDPAEVVKRNMGRPWSELHMRNIMIATIRTEDEAAEFQRRIKTDVTDALRWISRGFRFRPDAGDHDNPYKSLRT